MITILPESLDDYLEESKQLLFDHYKEIALDQDKVPLDPRYDIYYERERAGELLSMVMRDSGTVVGYLIAFISPGLHYKTCLTCITDIFFVEDEYRKRGAGKILFEAVEKELRRRGVQRWFMGSKMHKDSTYLFKKLGAKPVEEIYSKWIGDE